MGMKKWIRFVALLTAVTLLAGCNLVGIDAEMDAKQIVAKVGDTEITKGEWHEMRDSLVSYYEYMYSMYGMTFTADETVLESVGQEALDSMVKEEVIKQKAAALGLDTFTEEELAEMESEATETMDMQRWYYQMMYYPTDDPEAATVSEAVNALLEKDGYTAESVLESEKSERIYDRVREEAIKDVVVTDEEIQAEFDAKVEEQKAAYDATPTQYASDVSNKADIYYVPEGYRSIKHVLIAIDEDKQSEIEALEATLSDNATTRASLEKQLADLTAEPEEGVELTDEDKAANEESIALINEQLAGLEASDTQANEQLAALTQEAFDEILPKAEMVLALAKGDLTAAKEIYAQITPETEETATPDEAEASATPDEAQAEASATPDEAQAEEPTLDVLALTEPVDFQTLVDVYGEDPGMQSEPYATTGYVLCDGLTMYETAFQTAAMALENVGDVSELVQSSYGYHILCYMGDVASGAVEFESKKDAISEELLSAKQDEAYNAAVEQWVADANVKTFPKAMKDVE